MGLTVRPAARDELVAAGELTVAAYVDFTLGATDPYVAKLRDTATRAAEADLWVAVDGDTLLGTVTGCPPGSPWHEIAGPDEGEFRMLAVDPAARGRGVAASLVAHVEDQARDRGAVAMAISSLPMMAAAHRLYGRTGYLRAPDRDWSPLPGVDLIAFTKQL